MFSFSEKFRKAGPSLGLAVLFYLLVSCSGDSQALKIRTDVPELSLLVERYMAETDGSVIELEYDSTLDPSEGKSDLLIGSGLNSPPFLENLASLKELMSLDNDPIDTADFYSFTFRSFHDDPRLVVLSFDLPAIVSRIPPASQDFNEGVMLPLDVLAEKAAQYNVRKQNSIKQLGFSPLYSNDFLYLVAQYRGAGFGSDNRGFPTWNQPGLLSGLTYISTWSRARNNAPKDEDSFLTKYAYDPVFQLLEQARFSYAYSDASIFLRRPENSIRNLFLYWPAYEGKLRILDNFVAAAIPQTAIHKSEARRFIRWLLKPEVQSAAVLGSIDTELPSFGFLGGFPTNRQLTEQKIPVEYPKVRLRIPPENVLVFPENQGIAWDIFKKDVLGPWLRESVVQVESSTEGLRAATNQWLLHQGQNP